MPLNPIASFFAAEGDRDVVARAAQWDRHRGGQAFTVALLLGGLAIVSGVDALIDLRLGLPLWNIALDIATVAIALAAGAYYWWQFVRTRRRFHALGGNLRAAWADAARWRLEAAKVLPELGNAISRQFERWGLTPDEQQVALLLLNGLSEERIARLRHTSTGAVEQQAFEVYRKAGVSGRAALSAFFLQDLLVLSGRGIGLDEHDVVEEPRARRSRFWN